MICHDCGKRAPEGFMLCDSCASRRYKELNKLLVSVRDNSPWKRPSIRENTVDNAALSKDKERDDIIGLKVKVYYHLPKQCLSIQHKGKVIAHVDSIILENVKFVVREGGRQRVLREHRKNVHAFVCGTVVVKAESDNWRRVFYNPYVASTFFLSETKEPVRTAPKVYIVEKTIFMGE